MACSWSTSATTTSTTWPIATAFARRACASTPSATIAVAARWSSASRSPAGLNRRGVDAAFVATGQTGILVAGSGCPVDRVISDFVSGAAEKLVLANQHHEVIVVEGQGSLFHPRYSCVTLGLLHGLMPHGLILCYEMGRKAVSGMESVRLPAAGKGGRVLRGGRQHHAPLPGDRRGRQRAEVSPTTPVAAECDRVSRRLGLPACDVIRQGPDKLVEAVLKLRKERASSAACM